MQAEGQQTPPIELQPLSEMNSVRSRIDRARNVFYTKSAYQPVGAEDLEDRTEGGSINEETGEDDSESFDGSNGVLDRDDPPFSWIEYTVFLILGIAMLWAW